MRHRELSHVERRKAAICFTVSFVLFMLYSSIYGLPGQALLSPPTHVVDGVWELQGNSCGSGHHVMVIGDGYRDTPNALRLASPQEFEPSTYRVYLPGRWSYVVLEPLPSGDLHLAALKTNGYCSRGRRGHRHPRRCEPDEPTSVRRIAIMRPDMLPPAGRLLVPGSIFHRCSPVGPIAEPRMP